MRLIPVPRTKKVKDIVDYFERKNLPAPPQEWLDEIESETVKQSNKHQSQHQELKNKYSINQFHYQELKSHK